MGSEITDLSINNHIADALRHAMLVYGDSIIEDPGLIEIVRDHGAFHDPDCAEDIIQMLIVNGRMSTLLASSRMQKKDMQDRVDKEVCDLRYVSSYSESDISSVLYSLLKGMNMNLELNNGETDDSDYSEIIKLDTETPAASACCAVKPRKENLSNDNQSKLEYSEVDAGARNEWKKKYKKAFLFIPLLSIAVAGVVFVALNKEKFLPQHADRATDISVSKLSSENADASLKQSDAPYTLKRGMTGQEVAQLIAELSRTEYLNVEDVINIRGSFIYDQTVERAVGLLQRDLGMRQNGVYDSKLNEVLSTFWRPEYRTWKLGSRILSTAAPKAGTDVDMLVEILTEAGFSPDPEKLTLSDSVEVTEETRRIFAAAGIDIPKGIAGRRHCYYSKDIENSLKNFQIHNGLKPSGQLNKATLNALSDIYLKIKENKPSSYDAHPTGL